MGIDKFSDSNVVSQRCVVYAEMGRHRELAVLFKVMGVTNAGGVDITPEDIVEHAEAVCELWGVKHPGRSTCHVCSDPCPKDKLCRCYYDMVITTLNLKEYYVALPHAADAVVALSYVCLDCDKVTNVTVKTIRFAYLDTGKYSMPTRCPSCHYANYQFQGKTKEPKKYRAPKLGETQDKLAALQKEAAAASSASTPEG